MNNDKETRLGVFYALFAFGFWGLIPIYFKAINTVPAIEVLAHRVVWSVVFLMIILWYKKEFKKVLLILKNSKTSFYLLLSSVIIAINWLTFIWGIEHNQIIETSLGYYINPLVSIFFGYIFLKEIPTFRQKIGIFLGFIAVCYQLYILGYFPMVSLLLAITFPTYGLIRKKINIGSLVGLFVETLFLLPIAAIYLAFLSSNGQNHFAISPNITLLLMLAGVVTVLPLLAFNGAATRLRLSTIGYFQYLGPSISFILAVFLYNEPISYHKLITFSLIWVALFIISTETIKRKK